MALTNRITGESLDQEILNNQQAAQTEEPMLTNQSSEPTEIPTQTKPRRKKQSEPNNLPLHTTLYLIEQTEAQIKRINELGNRMEAMLQTMQSNPIPQKTTVDAEYDQTIDELGAELGQRFDGHCKRIVDQRLSDAQKKTEHLCRQLSRAGRQAVGHHRLLIGTLVSSIASLLLSVATIILLLSR